MLKKEQENKSCLTAGRMVEGHAFKVLNCSFCSKLLDDPRILPTCHHSFCTRCLRALYVKTAVDKNMSSLSSILADITIKCPICKKDSEVPRQQGQLEDIGRSVDNFCDNFSAKRAVEAIGKAKLVMRNAHLTHDCPHAPYFEKDGHHYCQHCRKTFCSVCIVTHKEIMRLEINAMNHNFDERKKSADETFDVRLEEARKFVRQMVETAEMKAIGDADAALEAIKVEIYANRDRLIAAAREIGENELADLKQKSTLITNDSCCNFAKRIDQINDESCLSLETSQLAKLHQDLLEFDAKLRHFEEFDREAKTKTINYRPGQNVVKSVSEALKMASVNLEMPHLGDIKVVSVIKQLHQAAEKGDLPYLTHILTSPILEPGVKMFLVNSRNPANYDTLLMEASREGSLDIVRFLVEEMGADLYMTGEFDNGAIHEAATRNHLSIVQYLLKTTPGDKWRQLFRGLLHVACYQGSGDVVRYLIDEAKWPVDDTETNHETTPLYDTNYSGGGKLEIVKFLVERGAKIDFRNKDGDMAIHGASENGYHEALAFFLDKKPDLIEICDHYGRTPLLIVSGVTYGRRVTEVDKKCLDITDDEIQDENIDPAFFEKVNFEKSAVLSLLRHQRGRIKVAETLIERGANLRAFLPQNGFMAVHLAAANGNVAILRKILQRDPGLASAKTVGPHREMTPLQATTQGDNDNYCGEIVRILVKDYNVRFHRPDSFGRPGTLLEVARHGDLDTVKFLLDRGADINDEMEDNGINVLHCAILSRNLDLVKFLVQHEPTLLNRSSEEGTPLRMAIQLKIDRGIINYLLDRNASLGEDEEEEDGGDGMFGQVLLDFGGEADDEIISSDNESHNNNHNNNNSSNNNSL